MTIDDSALVLVDERCVRLVLAVGQLISTLLPQLARRPPIDYGTGLDDVTLPQAGARHVGSLSRLARHHRTRVNNYIQRARLTPAL